MQGAYDALHPFLKDSNHAAVKQRIFSWDNSERSLNYSVLAMLE